MPQVKQPYTETLAWLTRELPVGVYLAGGAMRALIMVLVKPECPKDIDIFFKDQNKVDETVRLLMDHGWYIQFGAANASGPGSPCKATHPDHAVSIDLVTSWFSDTLYQLLYKFDFRCCQFGWSKTAGFVDLPHAVEDATDRVVNLVHIDNKAARIQQRVKRYRENGWRISAGTISVLEAAAREDL